MKRYSPPVLACWFLESVLPVSSREEILGDLIEEFSVRAESTSPSTAARWFWSQSCRSVPRMLGSSLQAEYRLPNITVAMGVFIAMAMFKLATVAIASRLVSFGHTGLLVLTAIEFLMATAIGGCIAARIRRGAKIFLAFIVMLAVAILIEFSSHTSPWWYQFGFLTLGPLAVLITPVIIDMLTLKARGVKVLS